MLTPELTKDFWSYMQKEFGSSIVQKDEALLMEVAGSFLETLKIQNKEHFMKDFVTTLYKTIYIPFVIGDDKNDRWPLWNQIRVCVHEHQHIVQGNRDGWCEFGVRYTTSSSFRAGYEAEAFGSDLEMEFYRTGAIFDIGQRSSVLKDYGCSADDIDMAKQILTIRSEVVLQGAISNISTIKAIKWLDHYIPDLCFVNK
jgi:hypothetical protein